MKRKLKLNKLTVANLNRVKGGSDTPPIRCICMLTQPQQAAYIHDEQARTTPPCVKITFDSTCVGCGTE